MTDLVPEKVVEFRRVRAKLLKMYRADHTGFVQRMRAAGLTLSDVSELVGISRERIRQIELKARE